mgnify:CR=1 FL=1
MGVANGQRIAQELDRIRKVYVTKDGSPVYARAYCPLGQVELGYHLEQLRALGTLLREAGHDTLTNLRVLDVGCGAGRLLGDLIGLGADPGDLVGVDLSPERIATARKLHPGVVFQCVAGDGLPFEDRSFDLVTQSVVFSSIHEHLLRERLAAEMQRCLRVGGYVFWWDLPHLVDTDIMARLDPLSLFPGLPARVVKASWCPLPSAGIPRRLWRIPLGWALDCFSGRRTHKAALLGPM